MFLKLPEAGADQTPETPLVPSQQIDRDRWMKEVMAESMQDFTKAERADPTVFGDILVFIHGYNNSQKVVMQRHRQLKEDLRAVGYGGAIIAFDWPSNDMTLNYLEDRSDAKQTALVLVEDCLSEFVRRQEPDCRINLHLLAHSTGAFVVREAFDDADDRKSLNSRNWMVSQILFIGGDISSDSLAANNAATESLFRHCARLTNYSNPFDSVLKLSNVKRAGLSPRVGRVGLPADAPANAVNVNCGSYFQSLDERSAKFFGTFNHSWHIGDKVFAADLKETIYGDRDRRHFDTRGRDEDGSLFLQSIEPF